MNVFQQRVHAAAVALWWVVLIAVLFLTIQWFAYLAVMHFKPGFVMSLWGPHVTWDFVQQVWFWMVAALKLFVWMLALVALWLTLWARQLNRLPPT